MSKVTVEVPTTDPDLAGFTYVKRKSRTRNPKSQKPRTRQNPNQSSPLGPPDAGSLPQIREKFKYRRDILHRSQFLKDFHTQLTALLESSKFPTPTRLKMMGLGTLTHGPSLSQLSFGIHLASTLSIPLSQVTTSDPMYTAIDRSFLEELGLSVTRTEVGDCHDAYEETTMIFAPHVPKSVYEMILRGSWRDSMSRVILLGNNLLHYPEIYPHDKISRESPAILAIGGCLDHLALPTNFEYNNVFNDLAIQWVPKGTVLPTMDFDGGTVEVERFEVNADQVRQSHLSEATNATKATVMDDERGESGEQIGRGSHEEKEGAAMETGTKRGEVLEK